MPQTIFYAWQSDLPNNTNRGFIRDAIERALKEINAELGVEDALRPDQDTQDVPGNPSVAETIFEKIDGCAIFVPDVSIVTEHGARRPMPNPNVMIEYGRATRARGDRFIIPIFNEAYGDWQNDRPFDMRHKSRPVTYNLPEKHSAELKSEERAALTKRLIKAIRVILDSGLPSVDTLPDSEDFGPMRQRYFDLRPMHEVGNRIIGFWVGIIPLHNSVSISRPYEIPELFERGSGVQGRFENSTNPLFLNTMDLIKDGQSVSHRITPIQGGAERQWHRICDGAPTKNIRGEDVCLVRVARNGQIMLAAKTNYHNPAPSLYISWIMAEVANGLQIVERLREAAGKPRLKFGMMVELRYDDHLDTVNPVGSGEWRFGFLEDEWPHARKIMKSEPLTFGPIEVKSVDSFPDVMSLVMEEIYTAANKPPLDDFVFEI